MNKLGNYITKLMTTILDSEQEEFVKDLALSELTRLNVDINDFVRKHTKDISDEIEKRKKQLLQEDKNVKDK
jgi:predicted ATP-grasp superfamily ATP-dependent carboligase